MLIMFSDKQHLVAYQQSVKPHDIKYCVWKCLTLARKRCFATFAGVGGGGGSWCDPPGDSKRSVVELRGKDQQIAIAEYSRLVVPIIFDPRSIFDPVMAGQRSNFRKFRDFLDARVHISKSLIVAA